MRNVVLSTSLSLAIVGMPGCGGAPSGETAVSQGWVASGVTASQATAAPSCRSLGTITPPPPTNGHSMKTLDLNGDGVLDVVFGNTNETVLTVLLGLPGGGYGPQTSVAFGEADEAEDFDAGDLNGDGIPDLVVGKGYDFNTVAVLFGHGDGLPVGPFGLGQLTPQGVLRRPQAGPGIDQ